MTASDVGRMLATRLAVAALVAAAVVAVAFAVPAVTGPTPGREPLTTPEYDPGTLATTPLPAEGTLEIDPDVGGDEGIVVVDATHSNRVDRADLAPLVRGLTAAGYRVRIHDSGTLDRALANANAFVVVDPAEEFERNEFLTVLTFTNEGGHVLLVGEPNRVSGSSISGISGDVQESALTTLAARYDMSLGTGYLYNLETNGGNYKHVVSESTEESALDLDRVVTFTAASVHARRGTVLLQTTLGTYEAGSDEPGRHAVAVLNDRENVLLLGDSTFFRTDRFTVGDNERFVAYVVEFLVSGERTSGATVDEDAEEGTGTPDDADDRDATPDDAVTGGAATPADSGPDGTPTPPPPASTPPTTSTPTPGPDTPADDRGDRRATSPGTP